MRRPLFAVVPLLAGCGAPYHFIAHAEPNPFVRPGCRVVVEPIHAERLIVEDEPVLAWRAEEDAEGAASFDADMREADHALHERLADAHGSLFLSGAPDNTFVIRPVFVHWDPGGWPASRGVADFAVDVLSPGGRQLLDRITIETKAGAFTSGQRMHITFAKAGAAISSYISDNWVCTPR
jgi:hypothetical protein